VLQRCLWLESGFFFFVNVKENQQVVGKSNTSLNAEARFLMMIKEA